MLRKRHQLFAFLLGVTDAAVVAFAAIVAWATRYALAGVPLPGVDDWEKWFKEPLLLFVVPLGILCIRGAGLYRPRRDRTLLSELFAVGRATAFTMGVVVFALWAVGNDAVTTALPGQKTVVVGGADIAATRAQLILLAPALFSALATHRVLFRSILRIVRARGWNQRHIFIIGTGRLGQVAARTISRNSWTGMHLSGFITHHPSSRRDDVLGIPVLGGLTNLEDILEQTDPDAVYIALPGDRASELPALLARLDRFAVDVRIIPDVPTRYTPHAMTMGELDGMPVLSYRESPLSGMGGFSKRVLDVAGGVVALAIFSPLIALIALAIRLSSPGPVIFRQRRVSIGGETFQIYKFRTMAHAEDEQAPVDPNDPATASWTERDDPRITPIGRLLRKTSLDELPQLINVLRGEMSLVGPRPERPELIARFREDWRGYMLRHHVKAGMTGWAQVNGLRGNTSLRKRVQYDLFYVRNWSILFDVRILILTLTKGFIHRNAY